MPRRRWEETAGIENAEAEVGSRAERRAWLAANSNGSRAKPLSVVPPTDNNRRVPQWPCQSKQAFMLAPFLSIPVSLILGAGTAYCLAKALQGGSWVNRLNYVLDALMALGMLGMVWHNLELPLLPQLLLFGTASFWFFLQGVSRHEFALLCHGRAGRLSCLYHAAMLAAMVFMLALPHPALLHERSTLPVQHSGHASHSGHALTVAPTSASEVSFLWTQPAAQVLAILFAAAVLAWLLPIDRIAAKLWLKKAPSMTVPSWRRYVVLKRTYEAGTALTMSLMFTAASLQT